MQIVIDIPEQMYLNAKANTLCGGDIIVKAIKNGTPLPKGHGDLVDRDAIQKAYDCSDMDYSMIDALNDALTIIEADTAESEK